MVRIDIYARCGFSLQGLSYYLKAYRVFVPLTQESYDVALDQAIHYSKGDAAGRMWPRAELVLSYIVQPRSCWPERERWRSLVKEQFSHWLEDHSL